MPVGPAVEGDLGLNAVVRLDLTGKVDPAHRLNAVEVSDVVVVREEVSGERFGEYDASRIRCVQGAIARVWEKR